MRKDGHFNLVATRFYIVLICRLHVPIDPLGHHSTVLKAFPRDIASFDTRNPLSKAYLLGRRVVGKLAGWLRDLVRINPTRKRIAVLLNFPRMNNARERRDLARKGQLFFGNRNLVVVVRWRRHRAGLLDSTHGNFSSVLSWVTTYTERDCRSLKSSVDGVIPMEIVYGSVWKHTFRRKPTLI